MKNVEVIISEHLGEDWFQPDSRNHNISAIRVLLDRLQEEGFSLRRSVWEISYIVRLKNKYSSLWLSIPSQSVDYVNTLISVFGDLKAAINHIKERDYWCKDMNGFFWLLSAICVAVEESGFNSSKIPD